jgi:hypothetical protein
METLNNFINSLCPFQHKFTPRPEYFPKSSSVSLEEPSGNSILMWKKIYKLPDECIKKLDMTEQTRVFSLYTSVLNLISTKYITLHTFDQKSTFIEELIRLLISKIDTDVSIRKQFVIKSNTLIDDIKNQHYQSPTVILYLSVVLDINIIVVSDDNDRPHVEIYLGDEEFDTCKPCIILGRTTQNTYYPVYYDNTAILIYYEHAIIPLLVKHANTILINLPN